MNTAVRARVIACATVIEEMAPWLTPETQSEVLDFGLHVKPDVLRQTLQSSIDASTDVDAILLGYGMCSRAVIGVRATTATLVIPRVHDCIGIFLGSQSAYQDEVRREPGTYYLTKGWIAVGDSPFEQVKRIAVRHGEAKARRMVDLMLRHYTRLAFIDTGAYENEEFRDYARRTAQEFGLRFEEIAGAGDLVHKLLFGPWDDEVIVVPQGGVVTAEMFERTPAETTSPPTPRVRTEPTPQVRTETATR